MIVLEGADNSGKSTFANKFINIPRYSAGPAPKNGDEETACLIEQINRSHKHCIQDRLTCISQQIYANRLFDKKLGQFLCEMIEIPTVIIIYCRPPDRVLMDFSTHNIKSYDTEEGLKTLIDNQHIYINRYDALMSTIPHLMYDWTDPDLNLDGLIDRLNQSQKGTMEWLKLKEMVKIAMRF